MNDGSTLELDLRRSRRENLSWRLRSFARADRRPRQVRGRTAASKSCELALRPIADSRPSSLSFRKQSSRAMTRVGVGGTRVTSNGSRVQTGSRRQLACADTTGGFVSGIPIIPTRRIREPSTGFSGRSAVAYLHCACFAALFAAPDQLGSAEHVRRAHTALIGAENVLCQPFDSARRLPELPGNRCGHAPNSVRRAGCGRTALRDRVLPRLRLCLPWGRRYVSEVCAGASLLFRSTARCCIDLGTG